MIGKGYNQNKIKNSIIPNNIRNSILYVINKKKFELPRITIKEQYINNKKKEYIFIKAYSSNKIIDLEYIDFYKTKKLDINARYIVLEPKLHSNEEFDIVYCGKYIETIKTNGDILIKFENKIYNENNLNLYKLIIDISKKYGITNNNWKVENLTKKIMGGNDFLFKKLNLYNIPEKLFINFNFLNNFLNNSLTGPNVDIKLRNFKNRIYNYTILNIIENNLIKIIDSSNIKINYKIILTKEIDINHLINSNKYFYFADIKYNFLSSEVFNKIIYLGNFIKKEGEFLYFENIIINPKSEKLIKFKLYYIKK